MNFAFLLVSLGAALLAPPYPAQPQPPAAGSVADQQLRVLPERSRLGWEGKAVGHGHEGTVQLRPGGSLQVRGQQLVSGRVEVDMTTLRVTDIADAEENQHLIEHLSNADFFAIKQHPRAMFVITRVVPQPEASPTAANATVTGQLTIKGQTHPLTFPARVSVRNGQATVRGTARVDRTRYGIRYASASFFQAIGDHAIADEFTLRFALVAQR
ncbi:YceI family protein [Hymenobacter sp. BT664]|uniref:YceI family protein n=1 Tax=Hymenobacter montanus TaxID=2771359 RepID=A0A927BD89_9BACT|nr:YceI family protein [Hymenobacter montanus]MBD2768682.1 YceI family protein [Hymenobacter montanus]